MGRIFKVELEEGWEHYNCMHCLTQLAIREDLTDSKSYHCKNGKAYVFEYVVNITEGEKVDRQFTYGLYTVVDIFCVQCGSILGWKYETAHDDNRKADEGTYVIDRSKVVLSEDASDTGSFSSDPEDDVACIMAALMHLRDRESDDALVTGNSDDPTGPESVDA